MNAVQLEGWDEIDKAYGKLLKQLKGDDLYEVLEPAAVILLPEAQRNAPVDTGFLRNSGQTGRMDDVPWVGFAADYAEFVEFGTSKMPAQPFLRPAMASKKTAMVNAIGKALAKKQKEAMR